MRLIKTLIAQADPLLDLSEFRPKDKEEEKFRVYDAANSRFEKVRETYTIMHKNMTYEYVQNQLQHWTRFDKAEMTIMEALHLLNDLVDDSDPDIDLPNSVHAFQTAERIREFHPNKDWFHLVGLIHDLGKVMAMWGQPQWSTVGDTFPVGCAFSDKIVFSEAFADNPDTQNPKFNTKYGLYEENCGLDNIVMSFGHDEYMYQVLKHNQTLLPQEGLACVRYHSFYPLHTEGAYKYFMNEQDHLNLEWINEFNRYDLYSKSDHVPDEKELMPYYQSLVDKYCPGVLQW